MAIEQAVIDQAKRTDLVALVESRGVELKKNGKGWFGLCPFHNDKNPSLSVNPDKNLFQCFGCGAAGDAIRFVELFDKVDFKEAVARLSVSGKPKPKPKTAPHSVKDGKLLARVMNYYQHTLSEDPRGMAYLKEERGITDNQSIKDFGAGYVNGTLKGILPDDPEVINALKRIGILNAKGNEMFYNCVVFPLLDEQDAVVSLYGRRIEDKTRRCPSPVPLRSQIWPGQPPGGQPLPNPDPDRIHHRRPDPLRPRLQEHHADLRRQRST